jgi:hypothetical protein
MIRTRRIRETVAIAIRRAGQGTGILVVATAAQAATAGGRLIAATTTLAIVCVDAQARPGQEWCLALDVTTGIAIDGIAHGWWTRTRVGRHEGVFELRFGIDRFCAVLVTTDTGTDRSAPIIVRAQAPLL